MLYNRKAFGIVIGRLRVKAGCTQEHASALAGISRSHWAALEKGSKTARLDTFWAVAYALGLSPSELMTLTEQEAEIQRSEDSET